MAKGRQKASDRYREVAGKMAEEAGVEKVVEDRKKLQGRASGEHRWIRVPPPNTLRRLYIFAHECGHVALGHGSGKARHRAEFEAETWAFEAFERHRLTIPPASEQGARRYVAYKIRQALRRGAKCIDPDAREFAGDFIGYRDEARLRLFAVD